MSDQPKKPGGGAEDLLSKLFELDDSAPASNFSDDTKIDKNIQASVQKQRGVSFATGEHKSLDELLSVQDLGSISENKEVKKPDEFGDIFEGILQEDPESSEKTSIFTNASPPSQTEVVQLEAENPFDAQSGKTVMLEGMEAVDQDSAVEATQTVTLRETPQADPIEEALLSYEDAAKEAGHTEKIPVEKKPPSLVKVRGGSKVSKPKDFSGIESVSANEFAGGFSNKPIQVSSDLGYESNSHWKNHAFKWSAIATIAIASVGILYFGFTKFQSDAGLFSYRLEGFSVVRAYRAPSDAQLSEFRTHFDAALAARQSDDPKKIEDVIPRLKSILLADERNIEAASLIVEHSALLTVWYGLKSQWPKAYDDALQGLNIILDKLKEAPALAALDRAKAWRTMALGEPTRAYTDLVTSLGKLSKADDELLELLVDLANQSGNSAAIEKWLSQLTRKPGLRVQFVQALVKSDDARIQELGTSGYLPARVEELTRQSLRKENVEKLLGRSESLLEEVKAYPPLADRIHIYRGDLFAFSVDHIKAIAEWKPVIERSPKNGMVWLKLAKSYEEEAMWDESILAYREADRAQALSDDGLLKFAQLLRLRGKVLDAATVIEDALKVKPKSAVLYYEKGMVQLAIYQSDRAKEAFAKALELDPKLESAILGLAKLSMQRRDWTEAEAILKKISPQSSHYSESLQSLSVIAKNRFQFDQAEKFLSRAISENPKLESAYPDLVQIYLLDERDDRAMSLVKGGLEVLPRSPLLKVAMARIYQFSGNLDKALSELEFPRKNFGHLNEVSYAYADLLIDSKEISQAYEVLNPLVEKEVKDPELKYLRAKAFLHDTEQGRGVGSIEGAHRSIDGAVRGDEENIRYRILAAQVSIQLQDRNSAVEHLDHVLKLKPHHSQALLIRGDLYRDVGDYEHASQTYLDALKYTRFQAPIYVRLADSFKSQGQSAQAIEYYQKVTGVSPSDSRAHLEMGKLFSDEGKYLNAFKSLTTSIRLNASVAEAYYFLGFVQKELGDKKSAIKAFEKFLSMDPSGTEAATVRDEVYFLKGGSAN